MRHFGVSKKCIKSQSEPLKYTNQDPMDAVVAKFIAKRLRVNPDAITRKQAIGTQYSIFNGFNNKGRNKLYAKIRQLDTVREKGQHFVGIEIVDEVKIKKNPEEYVCEDPMEELTRAMCYMGMFEVKSDAGSDNQEEDAVEVRKRYKAEMRAKREAFKAEMRKMQLEYKEEMKKLKD